jgi:hypothetical protein
MKPNEFSVNGFKITIVQKPNFKAIGYTRPVNLDGRSIGVFLKELNENGQMDKLTATLQTPQQVWVCLSDEGYLGSDCRCTVCVEKTEKHDFSQLTEEGLHTLYVSASEWADFEVGEDQSPAELHSFDVYKMVEEIGYTFNWNVGFHFDNEHEWGSGKKMHFLLPVIPM